jgi:hypothetical protein
MPDSRLPALISESMEVFKTVCKRPGLLFMIRFFSEEGDALLFAKQGTLI